MTRSPPKRMSAMTGLKVRNTPVGGGTTPAVPSRTGFSSSIQPAQEHLSGRGEPEASPPKTLQRHKVGKALCGAKTRKGLRCVRRVVEGNARCPNHGGLSTGPKTAEGRARCTLNLPNVRVMVLRQAAGITESGSRVGTRMSSALKVKTNLPTLDFEARTIAFGPWPPPSVPQ